MQSHFKLLLSAATALALAGCGGSAVSPASVGLSARLVAPAKTGASIAFISDWNNHAVYVIRGGQITATLGVDGPEGVAVDKAHNLYVANVAGSDVLVYPPPYTAASKTLNDPGFRPNGVAVDADGDVAVTSAQSNSYGPGSLVFYTKGATSPTKTILADSKFAGDYYCAFDAAGNLYLDSENGSGPFEAGEVIGGIGGHAITPLTTKNLLTYPGGMQVTASGEIAILDQSHNGSTPTIYTYSAPRHRSFGLPVMTTALPYANDALAFAFQGKDDRFVLTADTYYAAPKARGAEPSHQNAYGQTQLFSYPAGRMMSSVKLPMNAILAGVAVDPPQRP